MSGVYESLEQFEWDDANIAHIALHAVTPQEAEEVLNGDTAKVGEQFVQGERRIAEVGVTRAFRFLVVVWISRAGHLRVVTAFPANKAARQKWSVRYQRSEQ